MARVLVARSTALLLLALSGCMPAGSVPSATVPPSPESTASIAAPAATGRRTALPTVSARPSAPTTLSPELITEPLVSCGPGDSPFPPDRLTGIGSAEAAADPAAQELRRFLAQPQAPEMPFPRTGWYRVAETEDEVTFVARGDDETPLLQVAMHRADAGWVVDTYGRCQGMVALPEGIAAGRFWLDPAAEPAADAVVLQGMVQEVLCASASSPDRRILPPIIVYSADAITITVPIRRRPGGQDCPGNPVANITIELAEPLGARRVLDGGTFPARDATTVPD